MFFIHNFYVKVYDFKNKRWKMYLNEYLKLFNNCFLKQF